MSKRASFFFFNIFLPPFGKVGTGTQTKKKKKKNTTPLFFIRIFIVNVFLLSPRVNLVFDGGVVGGWGMRILFERKQD